MRPLLVLLFLLLYALHQDFWLWHRSQPIAFGLFPAGLFYHVCHTLATAGFLVLLVKSAWPAHLERVAAERVQDGER